MPTTSAPTTSQRLLTLLSLMQSRRDWPGPLLAERLQVSERTVRRDIDRLRDLDYAIQTFKGPDGGYRLDASTRMPPLLFDDEQVVALAVALRNAMASGAGIEEAAARALTTIRQVMPTRLRGRVDSLEFTVGPHPAGAHPQTDVDQLIALSAAISGREELRFDYHSAAAALRQAEGAGQTDEGAGPSVHSLRPRRAQPHHLVVRHGLWYVVAWSPDHEDWRVFRADRITLRTPNGPRFARHELPGGDVTAFLSARFKGSTGTDSWPCWGEAVLSCPAEDVAPYAGDAVVEALETDRCRVRLGAWSWSAAASALLRFDADLEAVQPAQLRQAFAALARRASQAVSPATPSSWGPRSTGTLQ